MKHFAAALLLLIAGAVPAAAASRVKDIAILQNSRDNHLIGYGLVIGLQGTGDGFRNSPFTEQSVRAMLENLGISTAAGSARTKNAAAVIVTATLPPFSRWGSRIDVSVASLGDASSLSGGTLVETQLKGADNEIYAVAQGGLIVSGFQSAGQAETVTQGVPTVGRVPNGAIVERNLAQLSNTEKELVFLLSNPDFSTSVAMASVMNDFTRAAYGKPLATALDSRTVAVKRPDKVSSAILVSELEDLMVETEAPARVVVDERTGTIVIGADVRVSKVAVSHGALTVRITELPSVSQPAPFSQGQTAEVPATNIDVESKDSSLVMVEGVDLETLVDGLNQMGAKPAEVIAILQAIKSARALQAELVSQ